MLDVIDQDTAHLPEAAGQPNAHETKKSSQPQMNADIQCAACIRRPTRRVNGLGASMA
ncbi:MAG TPA: hypothetical protein VJ396_08425 [Acidiferrobacterales bacterium]|nr:hypothetical protein [Acidiferrobacterales bacterium]